MGTKPWRVAPLRRIGLVVVVIAGGLVVGFGGVAVVSGRDSNAMAHRRPLTPSIAAFDFPTGGAGSGTALATSPAASTTGAAPTDAAAFVEPTSARAAVNAFLSAEAAGDVATSYRLLAAADQTDVGSAAAWAASLSDRSRALTVQVLSDSANGGGVDVVAAVTRPASLDPFKGFISARAMQTWRAVRQDGAWRVRAEPVDERVVLPPDAAASAPAMAWVQALAACDLTGAARWQGGLQFYGSFDLVGAPCQEHGAWTAGAPLSTEDALDLQPLIEAYGPDVPTWTRLVPVQGPSTRFLVAMAPVGDDWRVIGVTADGR